MNNNILYISYDGMTDSLGRSQVLPYLCGLATKGFNITIISAEKPMAFEQGRNEVEEIVKASKIDWQPIIYTKRPPIISTLIDILKIRRLAFKLHKTKQFGIVHCRSYISAFIGLAMKHKFGCRFVFDMRGFFADERVDGNIWNTKKLIYRKVYQYFKNKEKIFMTEADAIISLTNAAKSEILSWQLQNVDSEKITVIPCCADVNHFDFNKINDDTINEWRNKLNISDNQFVLSYLGSVGTWYMLPEMLSFFSQLLKIQQNAIFLFITRDSEKLIRTEAEKFCIPAEKIVVQPATRNQVPSLASLSNASLFFIKPVWSKKASSPTKLAELMALGIPCLTNSGVGDVDDIIRQNPIGVLIEGWSKNDYRLAIEKMLKLPLEGKAVARQQACQQFSLQNGVNAYEKVYEKLCKC